jgi:hypothetical protein
MGGALWQLPRASQAMGGALWQLLRATRAMVGCALAAPASLAGDGVVRFDSSRARAIIGPMLSEGDLLVVPPVV